MNSKIQSEKGNRTRKGAIFTTAEQGRPPGNVRRGGHEARGCPVMGKRTRQPR